MLARLPGLERLDPNAVTVAILVPAALAGVSLWYGWWLLAALGLVGRMILATLDGFVAERFDKRSRLGTYLNRLVTEAADAIVLLGLAGQAAWPLVALVIAATWLVDMAGVLGLLAGGALQWTGPAAQADRLAILLVASLISLFAPLDWDVVSAVLLALLAVTAARRATRSIRELAA